MSESGFEVIGISSGGEELKDVERDENIRTSPVEMTRIISPFRDLKSVWQLYRIFKKEKPLIVHTHTPKAGTLGMIAARLAGVPLRLHTVAGLPLLEETGMKRSVLDAVEKVTYFFASRVYPNSHGLKDIILKNGYTGEYKLKVIGSGSSNGIDTAHFSNTHFSENQKQQLRKSLNISPDDFVFIFIGRLVKDKGINELVAAFRQISEQADSPKRMKLLLVGNFEKELDPLLPETEQEIEANPDIVFAGYQNDVRPYLSISNALVFPSYREGFPNVVMQAGAMDLPGIVTNINGCNEIVNEGVNGTIIPVKNTKAIEAAMQKMMSDDAYYRTLKGNARQMITSRYEQKVVWEALLNEYKLLINGKETPNV